MSRFCFLALACVALACAATPPPPRRPLPALVATAPADSPPPPVPACSTDPTSPAAALRFPGAGMAGCPSDVHVQPSSYDGYDVHFDCPGGKYGGMPVVVLRGHGTKELPQFGGKGHPLGPELEKQFFSLAEEARRVADAPSIHHVAGVPPCRTTGWVIGLELSDYRDVDAAIRNLGTWLVREGLGGEVVLWLLPVGPERHL